MKIALICPASLPCPPIRSGAIELTIDRSAPYLARMNYDVTVFSIQDRSLPNSEKVNGVKFIRYPKATYIKDVLDHLNKEFFDLIQVYNNHQWIWGIRKVARKSILVLSLHNLRLGHTTDDNKSKQIINTADYIVTVSKFLASDLLKRYKEASGKLTAIYTGEDPWRFTPRFTPEGQNITYQMKQELGIPDDYRIVLFVGRLVDYKGCHHLIQAMKYVQERHAKTALVIVGSKGFGNKGINDYISELKASAAEISKHIYFTNFIPVNQITNYYTMSDIFVCPSQWEEPLGRVLYESMAAGLPVVAANRGGMPEVISNGQNGFIIEQYDQPLAYADAINKLLDNEELRETFGKRNRSLICERYNFGQYALKLKEIFKALELKKQNKPKEQIKPK